MKNLHKWNSGLASAATKNLAKANTEKAFEDLNFGNTGASGGTFFLKGQCH